MNHYQKGFVIPLIITIIAVLAIGGVVYLAPEKKVEAPVVVTPNVPVQATTSVNTSEDKGLKTYTGTKYGFEFNYPSLISVGQSGESVTLNHSIPYKHFDFCNFKDGSTKLDNLTDFSVSFSFAGVSLEQAKKNTFVWVYEPFNIGSLNGFKGEAGVEGCGMYYYLFPVSNTETLIVKRAYITEFKPINTEYETYLNLPNVISPDQEQMYFDQILSSVKLTNSVVEMDLALYIQDKTQVEKSSCSVTKKVIYKVPKTTAVADASLKILFAEELSKYAVYKSVSIVNGVAKVMLESEYTPAGYPIGALSSCESSHLFAVLKDTLTQYSSIKSVELYSPRGIIVF